LPETILAGKKFTRENGDVLQYTCNWGWKNFQVSYNGIALPGLYSDRQVENGLEFVLPTGEKLRMELKRRYSWNRSLDVTIDERPVPGSDNHPETAYYRAIYAMFILAGLDLLFWWMSRDLADQRAAMVTLADGILTLLLFGIAALRPRAWPIYMAALLLIIDVIFLSVVNQDSGFYPTSSQALRLVFLVIMLTALLELSRWKKLRKTAAAR
jgi:hypothetical protein